MSSTGSAATALISVKDIRVDLPNGQRLLDNISFTLGCQKVGLVGVNGAGKTTLAQVLLGQRKVKHGHLHINGVVGYLPQRQIITANQTCAEFLGASHKLAALTRIAEGGVDPIDYETVGDDWLLADRLKQKFDAFGLAHISLTSLVENLSGGELTRLGLIKLILQECSILILDEPTNHLDRAGREWVYRFIDEWEGGLLIISHDRVLLDKVDEIYELSGGRLTRFGGNYAHYLQQKQIQDEALQARLTEAKRQLSATKKSIQQTLERKQKREGQAVRKRKDGSQAKVILDRAKGRSEKNAQTLSKSAESRLRAHEQALSEVQEKVVEHDEMKIDLGKSLVPTRKRIVEFDHVCFQYNIGQKILNDRQFQLIGPERVALRGDNGSGKTSFMRLITGQLKPVQGDIFVGTDRIAYLDQQASLLSTDDSVLDNFMRLNPELSEFDCRTRLAKFLFRNRDAMKRVASLSGGEQLRAALACVLMAKAPPQLLLLDEPTNHMDIASVECIEQALQQFLGAMVVVSHDQRFLDNIGITRYVDLTREESQ